MKDRGDWILFQILIKWWRDSQPARPNLCWRLQSPHIIFHQHLPCLYHRLAAPPAGQLKIFGFKKYFARFLQSIFMLLSIFWWKTLKIEIFFHDKYLILLTVLKWKRYELFEFLLSDSLEKFLLFSLQLWLLSGLPRTALFSPDHLHMLPLLPPLQGEVPLVTVTSSQSVRHHHHPDGNNNNLLVNNSIRVRWTLNLQKSEKSFYRSHFIKL